MDQIVYLTQRFNSIRNGMVSSFNLIGLVQVAKDYFKCDQEEKDAAREWREEIDYQKLLISNCFNMNVFIIAHKI